ncbi:MAG: hypothetical protein JWQ19_1756 [Subtercola sp.]|nr:hypothetical protein [Subtercola sp.]
MVALRELAQLIRSKNAGMFELTVDVMFPDAAAFDFVVDSGVLDRELAARLFGVDAADVQIFLYRPAYAIKFSFPRPVACGDPADSDLFGGQQFAGLVNLDIPGDFVAGSRVGAH